VCVRGVLILHSTLSVNGTIRTYAYGVLNCKTEYTFAFYLNAKKEKEEKNG
jgi:hypothetical protein